MSTELNNEQLRELIIGTYRDLRDAQSNQRMAKKSFAAEVEKTSEYRTHQQAKEAAQDAKLKLDRMIDESPELTELKDDVTYYNAAVTEKKDLLSRLLVKQAVRTNNASVDIGDANPHAIILKAVLGQEAPEQLPLFAEDGDEVTV